MKTLYALFCLAIVGCGAPGLNDERVKDQVDSGSGGGGVDAQRQADLQMRKAVARPTVRDEFGDRQEKQRCIDARREKRRINMRLWMVIGAYTIKKDGTPDLILLTTDEWWDEEKKAGNPKLIWMEAGKKIILPKWFTYGKNVQAIRSSKLEEAWERHMPGVYKIDYEDNTLIKDAFSGFEIEYPK